MSSLDMLLEGLPEAGRSDLFAALQSKAFAAGELLIPQDAPSQGLFIVDGGTIRISLEDQNGSVHVSDLGPGEVVGEIALVEQGLTHAQVVAQSQVKVRWLSPEAYDSLVERFPELRMRLRQLAEERVDSLQKTGASDPAPPETGS